MITERESDDLTTWLSAHPAHRAGSALLRVELVRSCRRVDPRALPAARRLLAATELVPVTSALLDDAAELEHPHLRSLDAIHLAGALSIRDDLTAFVAYDERLADAARAAGLVVVQPGARASH